MNHRHAQYPQERRHPERQDTDPEMGRNDVYYPMRRERCDAKDDEVGEEVGPLGSDSLGPGFETGSPARESEECGTECGGYEVAERCACGYAGAGEGEGDRDAPDGTAEDGEVHRAR